MPQPAKPPAVSRRWFLSRSAAATLGFAAAGAGTLAAAAAEKPARPPSPPPGGPPADPLAPAATPKFDGPADEAFWREVRSHFNIVGGLVFLNNGTLGPVPRPVRDTRARWDATLSDNPRDSFRQRELDAVRRRLAAFVNASPDEIAITRSTTEGLNIFARGLDWRPGDEVVIGSLEHFSATGAYQALEKRPGIKIVTAEIPLLPASPGEITAAYARAITPRTRVLVASHVSYVNGLIHPLAELAALAHRHGALLSVDGVQALGALPFDAAATGVDHYASGGQKWLLAGTGTGVFFLRKELQDQIIPLMGHHNPGERRGGPPSARRYEQNGQYNIPAAIGIGAAVDFQNAVGKQNIEARVRALGGCLRDGAAAIPGVSLLTPAAPALSAGITSLAIAGAAGADVIYALQTREGITVRGSRHKDADGIRVSTHFYNTPAGIDRLLAALRDIAKNPSSLPKAPRRGPA
ncbi:MAG: aminotransferase class V-fold PLP-dependent enzyme [Opitutaceae bacterium]|nr:aminotransferase class V-fold PLP-dependent enzyme [Opitutaceae bacterium]